MVNQPQSTVPITEKQLDALDFIKAYRRNKRQPPTRQDIADHFKITIGAAQDRVTQLIRKGYITQVRGKARSLTVIAEPVMSVVHGVEIEVVAGD